ncbi:5'_nucleotidase family protein [Hexamita inflata]|uniref:5' nucleotidase family protein n=1 Tax=Hexamita inflata TaxID=28002 RepID=A0AA86TJ07_9EUKA|nr:5' nucleotidase family protein [Hexamita inflata]
MSRITYPSTPKYQSKIISFLSSFIQPCQLFDGPISLLVLQLYLCLSLPELHVIHVSDIHGGIYGHKDQPELGDIGTLLSYYQRVQQNISSNPEAAMLLIGTGDDCEGTALSGLSEIKCSEIYKFLTKLPFDMMTVGNHDLSQLLWSSCTIFNIISKRNHSGPPTHFTTKLERFLVSPSRTK